MDRVKISYLAAGWAKNETISGYTVTNHTIDDITIIVVYGKDMDTVEDYMFRDVFRIHRKRGQNPTA